MDDRKIADQISQLSPTLQQIEAIITYAFERQTGDGRQEWATVRLLLKKTVLTVNKMHAKVHELNTAARINTGGFLSFVL